MFQATKLNKRSKEYTKVVRDNIKATATHP